jgi:hypothetical protein
MVLRFDMVLFKEIIFGSWDAHRQCHQHFFLQCATLLEKFIRFFAESAQFWEFVFRRPDVGHAAGGRVVANIKRFFEVWRHFAWFG